MQKWAWIYGLRQDKPGILHSDIGLSYWEPFLTPGKCKCSLSKPMQSSLPSWWDKMSPSHLMCKSPFLQNYTHSKGRTGAAALILGQAHLKSCSLQNINYPQRRRFVKRSLTGLQPVCQPRCKGLSWRRLHCSRCPQADGHPAWAQWVLWDVGTLGTAYGTWSSWKPRALFGNDVPWGWHWLLASRRTQEHCRNLNRPAAVKRMTQTHHLPLRQKYKEGILRNKEEKKKTTPERKCLLFWPYLQGNQLSIMCRTLYKHCNLLISNPCSLIFQNWL